MQTLLTNNNQSALMLALEQIFRSIERLDSFAIRDFWDPQKCKLELLPLLAQTLNVNEWNDSWSEEAKRGVCQTAILVNMHKGTTYALKQALQSLGLNARVVEWFENDKPPLTAEIQVEINSIINTPQAWSQITNLVNSVKRCSVHVTISEKIPEFGQDIEIGSLVQTQEEAIGG